MVERTDRELIDAVLAGDKSTYNELYERYVKPIYNGALKMLRDVDDAEDVTQITFVKAFKNLAQYDSSYKVFSWLYRIMCNEALNVLERRRKYEAGDDNQRHSQGSPINDAILTDTIERLERALVRLPDDVQVLLVLRYYADLSVEEVGYVFDIPSKTAKSRLFSARERLRDELRKYGVEEAL